MDDRDPRKLDVTIQSMPQDAEEELSLGDIFHALKHNVVKLVAWVLIGALIGGMAGIAYVLIQAKHEVTTVISFSYDGVEQGLDPAGAVFDINLLKAPQVVEPAFEALGWGQTDDVNPEAVRQAMSIHGFVPQDVIDRLTVITTIATNSSAVTNLEKVLDVTYYPTRYKINLDADMLKLSTADACKLLDAVLVSYSEYFFNTYANVELLGTAVKGLSFEEYDYTEAVDVMRSQLAMMQSYVDNLNQKNKDFRSVRTGYTFADILTSLEVVDKMDLQWLDSLVYSYNLTRDRQRLESFLNFQKEEYARQLTVAQNNQTSITGRLNSYKKDTIMMMGGASEGVSSAVTGGVNMTIASEEYDHLVEQSIEAAAEVSEVKSNIDKTNARIEKINIQDTIDLVEYEKRAQQADERLVVLSKKINDWTSVITETADEFYSTTLLKDAYKVVVPSQDASQGRLMQMIKYGALGAVGLAGVVLVIYVIAVCLGLAANGPQQPKRKDKRRRKAAQA